ncbi:hybrid sensor histidine kinase/response regulator [Nocardioides flavescens]|uniref:Circadian input-output histidine kinase CikA n=1 Tax=Nocardioides flavescens TaxID=2691959 RepID=A0A6L7EX79_9ACTN|nr:response regulator [Nocardioides flavescens]MXG88659.1 response regulator [Nocardioides flavescens]
MDLADLYRDIVETSPDGIWVVDLDGRTVYANPEIARIHGIPESDLPDLTVFDTLDEQGRTQFAAHLDDVRGGRIHDHEVEVQWVRRDGSIVWVLCRESAMRDDEGRTVALLHRYSDFTERRRMIDSLRASEEALEDQIAQNTVMQAVASAANEAHALDEVLDRCRHLVLLHDDWERARAFVPDDEGRMSAFFTSEADRAADADDPFAASELELAQRCYDDRHLVWDERRLTVAFPISLDDTVYAVIAITSAPPLYRHQMVENMVTLAAEQLSRVVERELHQAALAAARDSAMEASRQKSDFLATMSHEIRTPLNGVIGLNDLLMRTALSPEQQRLVSGTQVASRTLLDLINDILDFSKIEAGRLELERRDFEVRPLLHHVAGLLGGAARAKGIDLVVECDDPVPPVLSGDPTRLAQVVTNLVSNAVKFTERGGVRVCARLDDQPSTVDDAAGVVRMHVEVTDTGVGVSPEKLRGLFDPFTQADSSTTRVYGGTGLGLAISREIVEAMGGALVYSPNPEGGSVFSFTVTLHEGAGDETPVTFGSAAPSGPQLALQGRRALLLDDTGTERQVLDDHLAWWGVEVERLSSVAALDEHLGHARPAPDVMLLDLTDPAHDVARVVARLRAVPSYAGVGVLLLTPEGSPRAATAGLQDVGEVLDRPVHSSALLEALRRLIPEAPPLDTSRPGALAAPGPHTPSKGWILVVEDNPVNQMVATGLLAALGYTADTADDGLAAIEAARAGGFDAILMDVQMPHMDGYTATERIRAGEAGTRRPIIAMTAAAVEGERERCLAAGMDDFLTKPIDAARLAETLERWLRPDAAPAPDAVPPAAVPPAAVPPAAVAQPAAGPATGPIDVSRLDELRELDQPGRPSYVARAVENYLGNLERDLALLSAATDADDHVELRAVAHRFAGASLNLGAARSGETARALEQAARHEDTGAARALLEQLLGLAEADAEGLRAYLRAAYPAPVS